MGASTSAVTSCRASRGDLRGGGGSGVDKFGGALCVGRSGEQCSVIRSQHLQPGCDIGRMIFARFKGKLQVGAQERGPRVRQPVPRQRNLRCRSDARRSHGRAGSCCQSSEYIHGQGSRSNWPRRGNFRMAASGSHRRRCCRTHGFHRVGWLRPRLRRTFPRVRCGPQGRE